MEKPRRLKVIACEILFRELCYCAAHAQQCVDLTFLPKALHDIGARQMSERLQQAVDATDLGAYDAILLAYGLCNNGICNLRSPLPLVIPRAHDCITLLLGSRERYQELFNRYPGTYYQSTGWIERAVDSNSQPNSVTVQLGISCDYHAYVAKYGEENARYLMEMLGDWTKHYSRLVYIDTGFGDFGTYAQATQREAEERGWAYEWVQGNTGLLQRLLDGDWNTQDFLVIPPNTPIEPTYDDRIICCGKICQEHCPDPV